MKDQYQEFLESKIKLDHRMGFEVDKSEINPILKPHQRDIVHWALRGGRRAIFAAFGLGKTFMQLECLRIIGEREGGRQLNIMPLGVRQEFKIDAEKLGIEVTFIRRTAEVGGPGIYITNYESVRDGRLDVNLFNAVSLDEASCLRSYGSLTFQTFLTLFSGVKYRFVATATPSPNRFKELIHYAGFLGIMDTGQALTRFFKRDSTKANQLTLYEHKQKEFWLWVSSWAIFLQRPSDLGYDDTGYALPELHVHFHEVGSNTGFHADKFGQFQLLNDASMSLVVASREKRNSVDIRVEKMLEIVKAECTQEEQFIVWCDLDAEQRAIEKVLSKSGISCASLFGSTDIDKRETLIQEWKDRKRTAFVSKPMMYGSGINMQQCNRAIFIGINFKANDFLQAIHRIHRFQQDRECHIHLIFTDTERGILEVLKKKWDQHNEMVGKMTEIIKKYGLSHIEMETELRRSIGIERIEASGEYWLAANNDTVLETRSMADDSVHLIHTSIPFANHYEYTPSYNDFGHTSGNGEFWKQMDFLTPELFRVLSPGRIAAIHIKDRILFGNVTGLGFPSCDNMLEETSLHFQRHGFKKVGIITIVTDVVRENNQTYRLGWTEQCKDGSKMGVGCPEYVLLFRKPQTDRTKGFADIPVQKDKTGYSRARWQVDAHAFWRSSGERMLAAEEMAHYKPDVLYRVFQRFSIEHLYDYETHIKIGERLDAKGTLPSTFMSIAPASHHPQVWHDVNRMLTLNGAQAKRKVQLHLCPLQFDIVDRIITRYSNPGEVVYDPFGGLMTVPVRAVKLGRYGRGVDLDTAPFLDGVLYLKAEERKLKTPSLFDFEKEEAEAA